MSSPRTRRIWIGAAAALVVLAVLTVATVTGRPGSEPTAAGSPTASAPDPMTAARLAVPRRAPGDPLAIGRVDAPVVVAEWGDFQCPFCRDYATGTEPALIRDDVDTGRVRIEWHDFAYLGPESVLAARAARAAGRQGAFWAYHDALYRQQPRENSGAVTDASLAELAGRLQLDVPRFRRDYADPAIAAQVSADQALGAGSGWAGCPAS